MHRCALLARPRVKFTLRCLRSLTRVLKDISLEPDPEFEPSNFACANFEVWSLHMRGLWFLNGASKFAHVYWWNSGSGSGSNSDTRVRHYLEKTPKNIRFKLIRSIIVFSKCVFCSYLPHFVKRKNPLAYGIKILLPRWHAGCLWQHRVLRS